MAFFPNFLKERYQLQKQAETRAPFPKNLIPTYKELLWIYKDKYIPQLFMDSYNDEITNEAIYKESTCPSLREIFMWISKKVLSPIDIDNYRTIGVYTRIGTSMLNNLEKKGLISRELNIYYHDNFVLNLGNLRIEMNIEELPF